MPTSQEVTFIRDRLAESEETLTTKAMRDILGHAERWSATMTGTPEGWTEDTCTAYRMAMDWTIDRLLSIWVDHPSHPDHPSQGGLS